MVLLGDLHQPADDSGAVANQPRHMHVEGGLYEQPLDICLELLARRCALPEARQPQFPLQLVEDLLRQADKRGYCVIIERIIPGLLIMDCIID